MRGLAMALLALEVPGNGAVVLANHRAGNLGAPILPESGAVTGETKSITKKTTAKTV
jgi:hypothetical protein